MRKIQTFIERELKLQVAEDKTGISTGREGINFLSYHIRVNQSVKHVRTKISGMHTNRRTVTHRIRLEVPKGKAQYFCKKYGYGNWQQTKPIHRPEITPISDEEIIYTYNAELRGLANYYALADDVKRKLSKLEYLAKITSITDVMMERLSRNKLLASCLRRKRS